MDEQELLDLKQEITESKENLSKLEGRKEALLEQLWEKYGVKTVEAAERKIESIQEEIDEWEEKIVKKTDELENRLNAN